MSHLGNLPGDYVVSKGGSCKELMSRSLGKIELWPLQVQDASMHTGQDTYLEAAIIHPPRILRRPSFSRSKRQVSHRLTQV